MMIAALWANCPGDKTCQIMAWLGAQRPYQWDTHPSNCDDTILLMMVLAARACFLLENLLIRNALHAVSFTDFVMSQPPNWAQKCKFSLQK